VLGGSRHYFALVLGAALLCSLPVRAANAAELRISFTELARIVSGTLAGAKLRLHNTPAGVFDFSAPSSLTVGNSTVPLPIPARTFDVAGSQYAYYLNDLNSTRIAITPAPGALRLSITFEGTGGELLGACVSGFCVSNSALPEIQWSNAVVAVDLVPTLVGGTLSLTSKQVDVGGTFTPDCERAKGLFSGGLCKAILPQARKAVSRLKVDINAGLKAQINAPEVQARLATSLRSYLKFGPAGDITINRVAVEGEIVSVTFCLACQ
jgi:hypothetical protein